MREIINRGDRTDVQINLNLAEALGWSSLRICQKEVQVLVQREEFPVSLYKVFDYKDPSVFTGVGKRYGYFPTTVVDAQSRIIRWEHSQYCPLTKEWVSFSGSTPEEVVALVAINVYKWEQKLSKSKKTTLKRMILKEGRQGDSAVPYRAMTGDLYDLY